MKTKTYTFQIQNDIPHCITTAICYTDGKNKQMYFPREVEGQLPPRVIEFMGFRMDNSEVIAIDDVKSIEWLRERLKVKEDFTDISIKMNKKNIVTLTYTPKKVVQTPDSVPKLECMNGKKPTEEGHYWVRQNNFNCVTKVMNKGSEEIVYVCLSYPPRSCNRDKPKVLVVYGRGWSNTLSLCPNSWQWGKRIINDLPLYNNVSMTV